MSSYNWSVDTKTTELAHYLNQVLTERNLSIRAFATYANMAHATVRRILAGEQVDASTLQKLADYLGLPTETVYRMAGMLPPEENLRQELIRLIEHLMAKLPESDQQEIVEIIRMKIARQEKNRAA